MSPIEKDNNEFLEGIHSQTLDKIGSIKYDY
uniref:Uncharacterized protein n=1 Tax=Siphoviridae sp. ctZHD14 TaxID=2827891 RepID=A0A8S5SWL7_9CAUD|nr:MAG TPA: hypothetical protein [Siphoviridae sp. ctZHD14]